MRVSARTSLPHGTCIVRSIPNAAHENDIPTLSFRSVPMHRDEWRPVAHQYSNATLTVMRFRLHGTPGTASHSPAS